MVTKNQSEYTDNVMRFVPTTPGSTSFGAEEVAKRQKLFEMGVPSSAARETQGRCDAVLRSVMNQVVLRAAESGNNRTPSGLLAVPGEPLVGKPKFRTPLYRTVEYW